MAIRSLIVASVVTAFLGIAAGSILMSTLHGPKHLAPFQDDSTMDYMIRNPACEAVKAHRPRGVFVITENNGFTITCIK